MNISKTIQKITIATVIAGTAGLWGILSALTVQDLLSPEINTSEQLEIVVERERQKIDPKNINPIKSSFTYKKTSGSTNLNDGSYLIEITFPGRESHVKHELYHILDGHLEEYDQTESTITRIIKYFLWWEPQATAYTVFGIKL